MPIFNCTCKHDFQDKTYGKGKRVFNFMVKERKIIGYRCTVCGAKQQPISTESKVVRKESK